MLKIIQGSFYSDAEALLKSEIAAALKAGKRAILIVPEQKTVIAESEMAKLLSDNAPLRFEVTNFTRLANSLLRSLGGVDKEYCDGAKSALIMWRTLTELAPTLTLTDGRREINYGMVKRALAAIGEADSLAIECEELINAKDIISENPRLQKKLDDLIRITALYKKLLSEKYSEVGEDIGEAVRRLYRESEKFSDTLFFAEGFISFTEPQYKLLELLIKRTELTVLLNVSKSREDAFEFTEPMATERRLTSIAKKLSAEIKLIKRDGRQGSPEALSEALDLLWQTGKDFDNNSLHFGEALKIYEAATPYDACDFIASDIRKKVMAGASYSDFAIVASSAEKYVGVLDVSAKKNGIPLFISAKADLASFEAIKLIYTAFQSVIGGFCREDVIAYAKSGLSGISREECDKFEAYAERWQINKGRFTDGIIWNMNPDGFSAFHSEETDRELLEIDAIRKKLLSPLIKLSSDISQSETVYDFTLALYNFIRSLSLSERLCERVRELTALTEAELAEENSRLYRIICDSLDTLIECSGDEKTDAEAFVARLKILFSSATVSKIPTFCDTVTAGSSNSLRLSRKKHIYMLGVNNGELPATLKSDAYFSQRDKALLFSAGLPFKPDEELYEARELYSFARSFSYATESVTMIYYAKDMDFSPAKRSEVIDRILAIGDRETKVLKISDIPTSELIYSPLDALETLGRIKAENYESVKAALIEKGFSDKVSCAEKSTENSNMRLSESTLGMIYGADLTLSQTKIDTYNNCPLAYFCKYDLRLSENEKAQFDARNIGSFIHAILENFFALIEKQEISVKEIGKEERMALTRAAAEMYLKKILCEKDSVKTRESLLIERLIRSAEPIVEGLCEEFSGSKYTPKYFELRIGGRGECDPELLAFDEEDGKRTLIKGSIDRVDSYKYGNDVYVRVIDYKTGKKDFKPSDLCEGKNLQMFLYLRAVVDSKNKRLHQSLGLGEDGRLIPAGVLYVKSDLSDVKISHATEDSENEAVKSDQKRQGMLLNDKISLDAMNMSFLPIRIKKDGSYYKDSENKLYSEEDWKTLAETVEDSVRRVTSKMRSGNISAEPMLKRDTSPCSFCKFKPMCRNAKIK